MVAPRWRASSRAGREGPARRRKAVDRGKSAGRARPAGHGKHGGQSEREEREGTASGRNAGSRRSTAGKALPNSVRRRSPARTGAVPIARRVVSLSRALSKLGIASRTEAEAMIEAGRVSVGDHVVRDPAWRVDLELDPIHIDNAPQERAAPQYWLLSKPAGYVTTRRDPQGRPTVYDLLPPDLPFVAPVGRLDLQSRGLLLLCNDTQLGARLTDPRSHVPKVYEVHLDAPISAAEARKLARGVEILGQTTRPAVVELREGNPSSKVQVTLVEGRNRQVRRMFQSIGRQVTSLCRVAIGPLRIEGLPEGSVTPGMPREALYTVTEVFPQHVVLDGNHPLAGMALRLHLTVRGVREATAAEVEAGSVGSSVVEVLEVLRTGEQAVLD